MIFTFYSYKGGVGRSMAMASVANLLARRGMKVLAIDFDLEAPGLERYFFDSERCKVVRVQPGLLDLIQAYRKALTDEAAFKNGAFRRWRDFCTTAINVAGSLGGSVDLMTAGRREPDAAKRSYALGVRSFDWQDFFYNWKGDLFFDWLRRQLRDPEKGYDAVLVDSRTGVTEMGGVCAYQLADAAVLLCAPNYQNLDGTMDVVRDFRSDSVRALRRGRPLEILALPARVDASHPGAAAFLAMFKSELGVDGLPASLAAVGLDYDKLALPYLAHLSVAEQLVGDSQVEANPQAPRWEAFERLADALTLLAEPGTRLARDREAAMRRLTGEGTEQATGLVADTTRSSAGYDAFLDYNPADAALVREIVTQMDRDGHRSFLDVGRVESGQDWQSTLEQALAYSSTLLVCFGQATDSEARARNIAFARRLQTVRIIPVLLPGSDEKALASFDLSLQQAVDLRNWPEDSARERLSVAMTAAVGAAKTQQRLVPDVPEHDPYPGGRAFKEDDAAYFFGREREIDALVEALDQNDCVLVTGPAQVGKTSLIQAGLLPRLRRMNSAEALCFDRIDVIDMAASDLALEPTRPSLPSLPDVSTLCLLDGVDSFDNDGSAGARATRLANLERLVASAGAGCKFMLVARGSLPPDEGNALMRFLQQHRSTVVEIEPLVGGALRKAIEAPARRAAHLLEPGLAERLVESAGSARNGIAQIQLALACIWPERKRGWLTNKNLDAAGHLGGIVARRRRSMIESLGPAEQDATRVLFNRLVALSSQYALVPSPQAWEHLASVPAIERVDAVALRDKLAAAGVVDLYNARPIDPGNVEAERELQVALARPDVLGYLGNDATEVDLPFLLWRDPLSALAYRWDHSDADSLLRGTALAEAQRWLGARVHELTRQEREFIDASTAAREAEEEQQRLRARQESDAREARERERLQAAEALAAEQGERLKLVDRARNEAIETATRLKRGRSMLMALLLSCFVMLVWALLQTQRRETADLLKEVESQTARAEAQSAEVSAERAAQALQASREALASAEQARRAAEAALAAGSDSDRRTATEQLAASDVKYRSARALISGVQSTCPVGRRLYLHIGRESDRETARALVPLLEKQGFTVPGIELVKNVPRTTEVRYFRRDEAEAAIAAAQVLQASRLPLVSPKYVPGFEDSKDIRPCHYEAWIAAGASTKSGR